MDTITAWWNGWLVGVFSGFFDMIARVLISVGTLSGALKPTVSHCFELARFAEAMDVVLARGSAGKVVLKINEEQNA